MKRILLVAATFLFVGVASAHILDWRMEAQICGNIMTSDDENDMIRAERLVRHQGCTEIHVVPVDDGNVLVYGVKIVPSVIY